MLKLIESGPRKRRTGAEAAISAAIHAGLIGAFVYATAQTGEPILATSSTAQTITFAVPKAAAAAAPAAAPKRQPQPRLATQPSSASPAPVSEPVATEFSGMSAGAGVADGPGERGAYYDYEVGSVAAALGAGIRPRYPDALRQSGIDGRVEIEFVVDDRGRVDMSTVRVIESTHELFTHAVRRALSGMRFSPAKVNGVAVRQFVRLPVIFRIER
jgi:TonB family protein